MISRAICLITLRPNKIWCDFLNNFKKYKIIIIIDDIEFHLTDFKNTYTNIEFIKIENQTCQLDGYINTNFTLNKLISGWDKALFPTIAIKNKLKCAIIEELSEIHYHHDFKKNNVNTKYIYHPIKDLDKHIYFRE